MKIVITGGAGGIGKALVHYYLDLGHEVYVMDINENPFSTQENLTFVQGDLKKKEDLEFFLEKVGTADVLINNAMESHQGILSECGYDDFFSSQLVGVVAPYYLSLKLKGLQSIINMTSTRAHQSQADTESYSAAKGGLLSLTHALSASLGPNTRVNAISPGWIDTHDSQFSSSDLSQHSVGRVGIPQDIIGVVDFLISDQATFITGQEFVVDGGMSKLMIYHGDQGWSKE